MGDTQFWFICEPENSACYDLCDWHTQPDCTNIQSNWANLAQKNSLGAFIKKLGSLGKRSQARGLIINGDLNNNGHPEQRWKFDSFYGNGVGGVRIYPGLGNHDIFNSVGACQLSPNPNGCVEEMTSFLYDYVSRTLNLPIDMNVTSASREYRGSLAYSWDECPENGDQCFHFVQLNFYPTYSVNFSASNHWQIVSALDWLKQDLAINGHKPTIFNFHDPANDHFPDQEQLQFREIIDKFNSIGIFFAHYHSSVGIMDYWRLNGTCAPRVFSGSVPGNNYIAYVLDPKSGTIKTMLQFHADGLQSSSVKQIEIEHNNC